MANELAGDVTRLLQQVAQGDTAAEERLISLVYAELRRLAARYMRREGGEHTLQPTALVHEAYLRLTRPQPGTWNNRGHFFAVAAKVMRQILVDHARAKKAVKRGQGAVEHADPLADVAGVITDVDRLLALDEALTRLNAMSPRQCQVVELRFFAGLSVEETAEALGIAPRTVKREWHLAKAWLYGQLSA